ncbi:UDP-N-acetyl glucosamine 2-epimerase [Paraoerskovia sediminicola]|uniref:UDP-N-acetylglucosamine 2-epimerase (non-hydrolyzing) n=1 Tax=Paraoerskovia sediminicola TaxID=1138587 RepID=A0ABM8G3X5_9CELL|nr:UDP-N-acetylglucosamine 2-epimerase (non-hydrolyzing) [Paraoerskovia sediminicola]BDZ42870.1 UDP-N-acetyl glucosamine 2-epimerase [Paraoerskovia sediminicola]
MPMTVMPVYGTRPEAIKMAPIVQGLDAADGIDCVPVVTGQHREMLDQVNGVFGIVPKVDLDIFAHGQGLEAVTARTLERLTPVLVEHRPDVVVVQGDTTSALAAGLAAFYRKIPVVHVEAGLRTASIASPFPEEGNRRLLTQITSLHLAPTPVSRDNLLRNGVAREDIVVTGNTVIDALLDVTSRPRPFDVPSLARAQEPGRRVVLVTSHRRESWGDPMRRTARAVARLAVERPETLFVLPLHANPLVREIFVPVLGSIPNVLLTDALSYTDFATLTALAEVVLTDSGGVQEEAPSLGKPVLVLREDTERPEAVEAGTARLVGTDEDLIVREVGLLLDDRAAYEEMANAINPYGDGRAAARTVAAIEALLGLGERLPDFAG